MCAKLVRLVGVIALFLCITQVADAQYHHSTLQYYHRPNQYYRPRTTQPNSQDPSVHQSVQSYHQLNVDDFAGSPQSNAGYIAYTSCSVSYIYQVFHDLNGYYLNFDVTLSLNKNKSWLSKSQITSADMLNEVLKHEQGHYNIAYLMRQEMQQELNKARYDEHYDQQVAAIFKRVNTKYQHMNAVYDSDTMHMLDRKQQSTWDLWLKGKLNSSNDYTYQEPAKSALVFK